MILFYVKTFLTTVFLKLMLNINTNWNQSVFTGANSEKNIFICIAVKYKLMVYNY